MIVDFANCVFLWITAVSSSSSTAEAQRSTGSASRSVSSSSGTDQLIQPAAALDCPRACFCNAPSRIVYCSRRGLASIPEGISPDSLQLNLNGNAFDSSLIVRRNLSRYIRLEHLYLSECSLEWIEVGAFVDLVDLRWLDLSNNRLRSIEPDALSGLRLQHLFLNGNRNVRIGPDSFAGLETVGLYLHDCSLSSIDPLTLGRLNTTLRYLWLNGNELDRVDGRLATIFGGLMHLRLGSNPLRCDCAANWLKRFYDRSPEVFKGAVPPTCLTPRSLKGRHFNELAENELRCQAPMFYHVDAKFDVERGVGRLSCTATGDPAPVLYWIQPSGRATKYDPSISTGILSASNLPMTPSPGSATASPAVDQDPLDVDLPGLSEAVLELDASTEYLQRTPLTHNGGMGSSGVHQPQFGMYICVADNEAGNATVTVSLPTPSWTTTTTTVVQQRHMNFASTQSVIRAPDESPTKIPTLTRQTGSGRTRKLPTLEYDSEVDVPENVERTTRTVDPELYADEFIDDVSVDRLSPLPSGGRDRLFTVGELTWAIVGSHVITLALCIVLAAVVCWRTGRHHGNDIELPKESYAFDATATITGFDLDRRQRQPDGAGGYAMTSGLGSSTSVRPVSTLPVSSSKENTGSASLHRGRVVGADREEWVRRLLTDYRTQQQQQQQQFYRTTSSSKGIDPLQNTTVPYQYNVTGPFTDTVTTSGSFQR